MSFEVRRGGDERLFKETNKKKAKKKNQSHPTSSDSPLLSCLSPAPLDAKLFVLNTERSSSPLRQIPSRDRRAKREGSIFGGEKARSSNCLAFTQSGDFTRSVSEVIFFFLLDDDDSIFFLLRLPLIKHNKTMFRVAARRLAPVLATRAVSSLAREGAKASTERAVRKLSVVSIRRFFFFSMVGDSPTKTAVGSLQLPTLLFGSLFFSRVRAFVS